MVKVCSRISLRQLFMVVTVVGLGASAVNALRGYGITIGKPAAWSQYYWGTAFEGQPVDQVIAITRPVHVERFGRYVELQYAEGGFVGLTAYARDGHLVFARAWECTQSYTFFDRLTDSDFQDLVKRRDEHRRATRSALLAAP